MSDIIIKPEVVEAKEKQKARDRQHERRRLAHDYMKAYLHEHFPDATEAVGRADVEVFVSIALVIADELIKQTDPERP